MDPMTNLGNMRTVNEGFAVVYRDILKRRNIFPEVGNENSDMPSLGPNPLSFSPKTRVLTTA